MDANAVPPFAVVLIATAMLGLFGSSLVLWGMLAVSAVQGKRWLPRLESRTPQPWGAVDLLFVMCLFVSLQLIGGAFFTASGLINRKELDADAPSLILQFAMSAICSLVVVGGTFFIMARCKVRAREVGWALHSFASDVKLGFVTFLLIAPPTYILMALSTKVSGVPYEHPIMSEAKENASLLLPAIIMAVVLAPLLEEFGFRVLLQGFLESLSIGRFSIEKLVLGRVRKPIDATDGGLLVSKQANGIEQVTPTEEGLKSAELQVKAIPDSSAAEDSNRNPYSVTSPFEKVEDEQPIDNVGETVRVPWWPTIVTGLLFGLAHFSYGVSWIPLIVLGIALGWLYRTTNRIWPCIVVHLCFNGFTMFLFVMHVLFGLPMEP
jgi:membrane protease YdiL (CAAX protease family)